MGVGDGNSSSSWQSRVPQPQRAPGRRGIPARCAVGRAATRDRLRALPARPCPLVRSPGLGPALLGPRLRRGLLPPVEGGCGREAGARRALPGGAALPAAREPVPLPACAHEDLDAAGCLSARRRGFAPSRGPAALGVWHRGAPRAALELKTREPGVRSLGSPDPGAPPAASTPKCAGRSSEPSGRRPGLASELLGPHWNRNVFFFFILFFFSFNSVFLPPETGKMTHIPVTKTPR